MSLYKLRKWNNFTLSLSLMCHHHIAYQTTVTPTSLINHGLLVCATLLMLIR